ncbi:MAG: right-handed parallel beta-helix repeat-containing protein [Promethearchaeota archaeon]
MWERICNRKIIFSMLIGLLLISSGLKMLYQSVEAKQKNPEPRFNSVNRSITKGYSYHAPITVNNDSDLAVIAVSGIGLINDPYLLANWNITGSSTHGISIRGTTKHFCVQNCWIDSATNHGIIVEDVTAGTPTILDNICNNNGVAGIYLYSSRSSIVANNTCNNNIGDGIILGDSPFSTLTNNTCKDNLDGITLYASGSSTVANNTCNNNDESGITLISSGFSTLTNNTCNNNGEYGISLLDSSFVTRTKNFCNDNGEGDIYLSYSDVNPTEISPFSTSEIDTSSFSSPVFTPIIDNAMLFRIFLFLIIFGLLLFSIRRRKSV